VSAVSVVETEVVAAGRSSETLALWRGDGRQWHRVPFHGEAAPVTATLAALDASAVAPWPGGWTWVTANPLSGSGASPPGAIVGVPLDCGPRGCGARLFAFGVPLAAVAATGPDEAWAAGSHVLVHCRAGVCHQLNPSPAPFGTEYVALAAGGPDDVWAILREGTAERRSSLVMHFDGADWRVTCRLDIGLTSAAVVPGVGARALWLFGDWSTVIRHEYGSSSTAERVCGP
jgi:hypothetical protein